MITNVLTTLGITRDSVLWFWGKLGGLIVLFAALGGEVAQSQYGIPSKWFHVIQLLAAWLVFFSAQQSTSNLQGKKLAWCLPLLLIGSLGLSACASAHKVAIVADQSFATAVFALDDAEFQACQAHVLTTAQCGQLNGPIKQALTDVKAVSLAIKATPTGVPASLPALLKDLQAVQDAIRAATPILPSLAGQASDANQKAIALLTQLLGGK